MIHKITCPQIWEKFAIHKISAHKFTLNCANSSFEYFLQSKILLVYKCIITTDSKLLVLFFIIGHALITWSLKMADHFSCPMVKSW